MRAIDDKVKIRNCPRAVSPLREPVRVDEHHRATDAPIELRAVWPAPAVNDDAAAAAMTADRALDPA